MGKIPCRLCGSCGLYNDLSVDTCECGADLTRVPGRLVDEQIPPDQYGEIDKLLPVFVQKCSACGAENFTADQARPVRICYNCHKARVASVVPVPYEMEGEAPAAPAEKAPKMPSQPVFQLTAPPQGVAADDDEEDDDDDVACWQGLLGGIRSAVGSAAPSPQAPSAPASQPPVQEEEDDEDEEGTVAWGSLLGAGPHSEPATPRPAGGQELTLTAIRYGRLSFTLRAGQGGLPFLLGRSAGYGDFLSQDGRVSNEHCYLAFQGGAWVVIDNHSTNGTAVNKRFLDINGQQTLHDGDELMLGHHPDSMAFRITIR